MAKRNETVYEIVIERHGRKNNDPAAHGTGVEALLDPAGIGEIKAHADALRTTFFDMSSGAVAFLDGLSYNLARWYQISLPL